MYFAAVWEKKRQQPRQQQHLQQQQQQPPPQQQRQHRTSPEGFCVQPENPTSVENYVWWLRKGGISIAGPRLINQTKPNRTVPNQNRTETAPFRSEPIRT